MRARLSIGPLTTIKENFAEDGATMARQGSRLAQALETEARAHQQLVNIGEELRTVYTSGQQPDDDEMLRLHQAYDALLAAARNMYAAVYEEQVTGTRKRAA